MSHPAKKKETENEEENLILNYESQDEETENIDEIFKRLRQKNNEENCKENKENDLNYIPLKVIFKINLRNFRLLDYLRNQNTFPNKAIRSRNKKNWI